MSHNTFSGSDELIMEIKETICLSFTELLAKRPIEQITVTEIVKNCQVSRATFYRHFKDKYDVMNYYYKMTIDDYLGSITLEDWEDTLIEIFLFIRYKKHFFNNAIKTDGENSFLNFLYDYSFTFYERSYKQYYQMKTLTEKQNNCIAFNCAGAVHLVQRWIENDYHEEPEEVAHWSFEFMPEELKIIFQDNNQTK